jgi:rhodanese-related sulfurtransferase
VFVDVRDVFSFEKSRVKGAVHIPLELLPQQMNTIAKGLPVIVYDETGKKGHQALRTLVGAGFKDVTNISGGHISMQRQARTIGFKYIQIDLLPVVIKSLNDETSNSDETKELKRNNFNDPIVIDVRTPDEFQGGAYPDSVNIPLDDLMQRYEELGNNPAREIVVYCASGARSAYAQKLLMQIGYTNVKNGGGIATMMANRNSKPFASHSSMDPIVIDVRTPAEFLGGAYPGAVNIPVDEVQMRINEFGSKSREITVYCASGARSAYAQKVLQQLGFTDVKNGGGIAQIMSNRY